MSCNKRWNIDGRGISPHSLTDDEVHGLLRQLEAQDKATTQALEEKTADLCTYLPGKLAVEIRSMIETFLLHPYQTEINDVIAEIVRREPLRKNAEMLKFAQEGRIDLLVERDRFEARAFPAS